MADMVSRNKGELSFENVLVASMRTPGVKIDRAKFLRKELIKYYPEHTVAQAIRYNPAQAGIKRHSINKIASTVINYETNKVTGLSIAASIPGSLTVPAAVGAATADITSYFAHILRIVQELAYLYGFEDFELKEENIDSETMDMIMIFLGVMFGVQGAAAALNKLATVMANHVAKKLAGKALTKGIVYPIVKKIATFIGVHMTKQVFADTVASAIPVVGSLASGALTYLSFKPCCNRLMKNLKSYKLSDPDFYKNYGDHRSR